MKTIFLKLWKKKVVKDYFSVAGSNVVLQVLGVIQGFIVAKFLGPADYGLLKTIDLIQQLNKFGNLGFNSVASREIAHAIGEGDYQTAGDIRNNNYSSEIVLASILFFIGSVSAIFVGNTTIAVLIFMASLGLFLAKIQGILSTENAIQKKFQISSKITVVSGLILCIGTIILVPFLKIYAIFLTNIAALTLGIYLYRRYVKFDYKFSIQKKYLFYSLKIGFPLIVATLALGAYKYAERLMIINYMDVRALGLFSFANVLSNSIAILFKASINVRMQDIFQLIGSQQLLKVHRMVIKETALLTIAAFASIPVIWIILDIFVPLYLDKYTAAIAAGKILAFTVPFLVIANYAAAVTTSKKVNKLYVPIVLQTISVLILVGGSVLLNSLNIMTLERYAILSVAAIGFYNLGLVVNYYLSFFKKYIKV